MYKTRTVRKRSKVRSLEKQNLNLETPVSSSEPVSICRQLQLGVPKKLFKSPPGKAHTYSLGVTYNVRTTPPLGATPLRKCRKCKHVILAHRPALKPDQVSLGKSPGGKSASKFSNKAGSFSMDSGSIVKQIKANIAISPYVRHYLERKLKEKLQETQSKSKLLQSFNLNELELVYNLDQPLEEEEQSLTEDIAKPRASAIVKVKPTVRCDTPARPIRGRTRTIRYQEGFAKTSLQPKSSIDLRKAAASKFLPATSTAKSQSHQYFTRTQARMMQAKKEKANWNSSVATTITDDELFEPIKPTKTRAWKGKAVNGNTGARFSRPCKTMAASENLRKAKTHKKADQSTSMVAPKVAPRKSMIPRFTGNANGKK